MIFNFFEAQRKNPTKKDWVTTVKNDLEELNINLQFEDIMKMKKCEFKKLLNRKIEMKFAFKSKSHKTWIYKDAKLSKIKWNTNNKRRASTNF